MLLQNVFCTRLMPADRPLKAAFAIFPTQGSRHHKYDTNVCKKGRTPMYTIDFTKPVHIHFIGIGGISMSGLAEILLKEGFTVIRMRSQKECTGSKKKIRITGRFRICR